MRFDNDLVKFGTGKGIMYNHNSYFIVSLAAVAVFKAEGLITLKACRCYSVESVQWSCVVVGAISDEPIYYNIQCYAQLFFGLNVMLSNKSFMSSGTSMTPALQGLDFLTHTFSAANVVHNWEYNSLILRPSSTPATYPFVRFQGGSTGAMTGSAKITMTLQGRYWI